MQEVQALDHQAKAHLEEAFRLSLEEKDEKISVMQMQVGVARVGIKGRVSAVHLCVCVCRHNIIAT